METKKPANIIYGLDESPPLLMTIFNGIQHVGVVDVRLFYEGKELKFPEQRPTNAQIRESEDGVRLLAGFLLRRNADRVRSEWKEGKASVLFHFDH